MKYVLLFLSSVAVAGAKFTIKPQWHVEKEKLGLTSGISIYQHMIAGFAFNSWAGVGYRPGYTDQDGVWWTAVQAGIDMHQKGGWIVTPEFHFRYSPTFTERDNSLNLKLTKQLW